MLDLVRIRLPRRFKGSFAATALGLAIVFAQEASAQEPEARPEALPEAKAEAGPAEAAPTAAEPSPATPAANAAGPEATTAVDERPFPPAPPQTGAAPGGYAENQGYGTQGSGYPPPPPDGVYRPFSFTLGAGPGILRLNNGLDTSPAWGISYALRFGFGIQPDLIFTMGFEGTSATKNGTLASQDALLLGLQYFVSQLAYVRGAMGIANETEEDANEIYMDQNGLALQGALGVDLVQGANVALSLEAAVMLGRYSTETWTSGGLNLLFSLY